jgi:hypothetical protein
VHKKGIESKLVPKTTRSSPPQVFIVGGETLLTMGSTAEIEAIQIQNMIAAKACMVQ